MQEIFDIKSAGLGCFPCKQDKTPKVNKDQNWKDAALLPIAQLQASNIWGLVIPSKILIIDLDLYKGITRGDADKALGCSLPWDQSLIQTTQRGGEHHAFVVKSDDIVQRNGNIIIGLDFKVGGKGYICFGNGYTPTGSGVLRLSRHDELPRLPTVVYDVLRREGPKRNLPPQPIMKSTVDIVIIEGLLGNIDPDCTRDQWRDVGFSLKHGFGDDPKGLELWDRWSSGEFSDKGTPKNYKSKGMLKQWESFKRYPQGGITINSLYHYAGIEKKREVNITEISKRLGESKPLVGQIGSYVRMYPKKLLVEKLDIITHMDYIPKWVIEDHPIIVSDKPNIKDKQPMLTDGQCASRMLNGFYGDRLKSFNGMTRLWTNREWAYLGERNCRRFIRDSLPNRYSDKTRIKNVYSMFLDGLHMINLPKPCKKIYFRDGVLNLNPVVFKPHEKENNNTGTLSVNYKDKGTTVEWFKFLATIFGIFGNGDKRVELLQEIFGWLLVSDNLGIEKYISLTGATRAGKGIILRILKDILSKEFCGSFNFSNIGSVQGHTTLHKFRVVIDTEAKTPEKFDKVSALETVQKVTSNETLSSRIFYVSEYVEGVVNCKMITACNHLPIFPDDSGASAGRIVILKFDKSFLGKEDFGLYDRLYKELAGIVHWAIEGLKRLIANNGVFTKPQSSKEEMEDLEAISKPLSRFIDDHLTIDPESKTSSVDLYSIFKTYAQMNNFPLWGKDLFIKRLKNTLVGKGLKWCRYRVNEVQIRGVIGLKIENAIAIPGVSPSMEPSPPTPAVMEST